MKKSLFLAAAACAVALITTASLGDHHEKHATNLQVPKTASPENARSYIISPANGEVVPATFTVKFGLSGMGIAPAGVAFENTGHHHLLIDTEEMPDLNLPLPATDRILHFGKGQTETVITLPPGDHTLQLVLGDHNHIPHDKPVISRKITVTVQ